MMLPAHLQALFSESSVRVVRDDALSHGKRVQPCAPRRMRRVETAPNLSQSQALPTQQPLVASCRWQSMSALDSTACNQPPVLKRRPEVTSPRRTQRAKVLAPTPPIRKCFAPPAGGRRNSSNSRDQLSSREVLDIVWEYGAGLDMDDDVGLDLEYF